MIRRRRQQRTGMVLAQTADSVTIDRFQRNIHVGAEAIAVVAVVPFMFWLSAQRSLPRWARTSSAVIGAGTLVIDGGLLLSYLKKGT